MLQGNPPFQWWEKLQQALCLVKHYFQFSQRKYTTFSQKSQKYLQKNR